MSTTQNDTTLEALLARMSDLERELAMLRAERPVAGSPTSTHRQNKAVEKRAEPGEAPAPSKRRSRRGLLRTALVSGAAVVGAGALLGKGTGVAHADGNETPTTFTSDDSQFFYAVQANGTNGAYGVYATSDSSYGVFGVSPSVGVQGASTSGTGVIGASNSQYGVHAASGGASLHAGPGAAGVFAEGGPSYGVYATSDSSTAIAGIASTNGSGVFGQSNSGYGLYGASTSGSGVYASGTSGYGVQGGSTSGTGVHGFSTSGPGVYAQSSSGPALVANGHVQVQGNAVGQATLLAGQTSVTVTTSAATASSNVLLTPLANPKANVWVTRAAGSFTIHISKALTSNLSIAYLIIN